MGWFRCAGRVELALLASVAGALGAQAAGAPKSEPLMTIAPAPSGPAGLASADPPALRYGVLYADDKGHSHVQYCDLKNFIFKSYAPPAAPQYVGFPPGEVTSIKYAVLPVGYVGTWHTAPGPQWVITLSGRWSVEATDGSVLEQGPGEVEFNADKGSTPQGPEGHVGHLTRQVGDVPNVQLIVSLKPQTGKARSTDPCQPSQP
ncbi:hypothetical protein LOK46_26955 [Methylobacterium sp. NMS14P]|uniref:hypothetical protein n=1 Tax=Methylobacterium sp. NMS14P TaxID=2894310 RepID=UPI002359BC18|nr:hypothetical protein [Methylobacterium sp. NMS14P]WCS24727.1 hypothetical protein LOK46_26955 [Methylobacterium sp. NMS14P]